MKMKKMAAASLAVCVSALSGMSALAATGVTTTTTYDYNNRTAADANVTVTTVVSGVTANKQVTYLVWDKTGTTSDIKYIDQKTATEGTATFTFTDKMTDIYNASVSVAKIGTDDTAATDLLKSFELSEGVNLITNGVAAVASVEGMTNGSDFEDADSGISGKAYYGKVSGNVKEYGFKVNGDKYPALGCTDDGVFCVVFKGLAADAVVEAYAE